jgi:hypothetical protein
MQFTREEKYTYDVLACERGNYYVGRIAGSHANVPRRFHQHRDLLGGAAWTKKHPVEAIEKIVYDQDKWQEDILVYHYMEKFGMDKVRGGSYSQCTLTEAQVREIEIKLRSANNACCGCGKQGHFMARLSKRVGMNGLIRAVNGKKQQRMDYNQFVLLLAVHLSMFNVQKMRHLG